MAEVYQRNGFQHRNLNESTIVDATVGDQLSLSKYIKSPVTVETVQTTLQGRVLIVRSSGMSKYRLRAIDDHDDRLLLEKETDDGWDAFIRLDVSPAEDD